MTQGWPNGPTPVVDEVQVAGIDVDGQSTALVRLTDALGDSREVQLTERAAWQAMVGITHFLRQAHQPRPS